MQAIQINTTVVQDFMHEDLGALSETEDDLCSKDYDIMNLNLMRTTSKCQDDSEIN